MAGMKVNRLRAGSPSWIAQERSCALQIVETEAEEFTFSVRNEVDWLNEHMSEIFNANQVNVAEIFKTPGKLRGKTPRTIRRNHLLPERPPLSTVFSNPSKEHSPISNCTNVVIHESIPREKEEKVAEQDSQSPFSSEVTSAIQPRAIFNFSKSESRDDYEDRNTYQPTSEKASHLVSVVPDTKPEVTTHLSEPISNKKAIPNCSTGELDPKYIFSTYPDLRQQRESPAPDSQIASNIWEDNAEVDGQELVSNESRIKLTDQDSSLSYNNLPDDCPSESWRQDLSQPQVDKPTDKKVDDMNYQSDGSSPIRLIVRKSSLNFASLPAREPITTKKSIGNRASRVSQQEQSKTSHVGRQNMGKSNESIESREDLDDRHVDWTQTGCENTDTQMIRLHNKISTQRLQDQINKLGQPHKKIRPSISSSTTAQTHSLHSSQEASNSIAGNPEYLSPEDDVNHQCKDSKRQWLGNLLDTRIEQNRISPRQQLELPKYDTYEKTDHNDEEEDDGQKKHPPDGPDRKPEISELPSVSSSKHKNLATTSTLNSMNNSDEHLSHDNKILVSNSISSSQTSPKTYRGSPLKAAKDKFSSILKNSRVLFANTIVANLPDSVATNLSESSQNEARNERITEEVVSNGPEDHILPSAELVANESSKKLAQSESLSKITLIQSDSSSEKYEANIETKNAQSLKETKESEKMNRQLEKARVKVREEARSYYIEQERLTATKAEETNQALRGKLSTTNQNDQVPVTRNSPRRAKLQIGVDKVFIANTVTETLRKGTDKLDSLTSMPPPAIRSKAQIERPDKKRPVKPAREISKVKPPTVIKVDIGSQRGQQYHPSNATLSTTLQESLSSQPTLSSHNLKHKASTSSIQSKSSSNSFKSAATKTLEAAARKKEKDELAAARKREVKLEIERQRTAAKEEERLKEEQRKRQEAENQPEVQRVREKAIKISEAKKAASRQAIEKRRLEIERAKESRTVPSIIRNKIVNEPEKVLFVSKIETSLSRAPKTQQEPIRIVCNNATNSKKLQPKRLFQQDSEEQQVRPNVQRNIALHFQEQKQKRRKTEDSDRTLDLVDDRPNMTAPPIRQSNARFKEIPTKSVFSNIHANTIPSSSLQRSTLISQHNLLAKPTHPLDMIDLAKGPIPFASSSNPGSSQSHKALIHSVASSTAGKTLKTMSKTAMKSSPRYPNGENIDLPEIPTDSENEDSEEDSVGVRPGWTDTPEIQKQLAYQESIDPAEVFGKPGPLNMEEVFSKSKDRFHKFRARTSSANWSGTDRLTEDEIQRDLEGRDQVRRQGGWTYDAMV